MLSRATGSMEEAGAQAGAKLCQVAHRGEVGA